MVKLEVVDRQGAGPVVDELGALVEKGRIVLVCLHHKKIRVPRARGNAEIRGHAADEKPRRHAGIFQDPGQQAAGGCLAVGTRDSQHPFVPQQVLGQPLGTGCIGQAVIEHVLHGGVATGHRVADDDAVRAIVQVLGQVALHQVDTRRAQLGAHGRVDGRIGTRYPKTHLPGQQGDAAHEGAADPQDVNVPFQPDLLKQSGQW